MPGADFSTNVPTTPRAIFNRRLAVEGRLDAYVALRDQLIRDGVPPSEAWKFAATEFPPLDGSAHEITNLPPRQQLTTPPAAEPEQKPEQDDEFILDGAGIGFDERSLPDTDGDRGPDERSGSEDSEDDSRFDAPAKRPSGRPKGSKNTKAKVVDAPAKKLRAPTKADLARQKLEETAAYKDLWANVGRGLQASIKDETMWIADNIDEPYSQMLAEDVPSRKALGQLKRIRDGGPAAYKDWTVSVYSKFIPARPADESDGGAGGGDGEYRMAFEDFERSFYSDDDPERVMDMSANDLDGEAGDLEYEDEDADD